MAKLEQSPIDGGYSYVIAWAAFLAHLLQFGFTWTMGVWYTVFMEQYDVGSKYVALISSLNTASVYAAGPLSSFLTNLYGARAVCIVGSLIGCTGVIMSVFADSVFTLYITFGLVAGFGFGLSYIPGISVVSFYFEKRRSIANGFVTSGIGLGTFLFPPIIAFLLQTYGLSGALLNIGGLCLHFVVIGALYRPWKGDRIVAADMIADDEKEDRNRKNYSTTTLNMETKINCPIQKSHLSVSKPNALLSRSSLFQSKTSIKGSNTTLNSLTMRRVFRDPSSFCRTISICDLQPGFTYSSKPGSVCSSKHGSINGSRVSVTTNCLLGDNRNCSLPKGSMQPSSDQRIYVQIQNKASETLNSEEKYQLHSSFLEKLNLDIFQRCSYLSLCLNNLLFTFGLSIVYVHLGSYAKDTLQLTVEQSTYFFSAIGIANFFGRFAFGALCQVPCFKPLWVYSTSSLLAGLVTLVCPMWDEYAWLMAYAVLFGFLSGAFGSLLPSVVIQVTELEKLSSAFGYLLVFEALGTLLGAPLAGVIYEWTKVYKNSFYMGGLFMVGAALAMVQPIKYARSEIDIERDLRCDLDEQFENRQGYLKPD